MFHNDLVDRKILVKRDLKHGTPMIKRQICKVGLNLCRLLLSKVQQFLSFLANLKYATSILYLLKSAVKKK